MNKKKYSVVILSLKKHYKNENCTNWLANVISKNTVMLVVRSCTRLLHDYCEIFNYWSLIKKSDLSQLKNYAFSHVYFLYTVSEDTHKKRVFLVVGPLRFTLPTLSGLVVHATFFIFFYFFSLIIAWNGFWIFFLHNFWARTAGF